MATRTDAIVGENIRRMREGRGLSFKKLSEELRTGGRVISPRRLSKMEKGASVIYAGDLLALADFFGCTAEMLAEGARAR